LLFDDNVVLFVRAEPSLTVDNDYVYKGQERVHGSKMWQPFG